MNTSRVTSNSSAHAGQRRLVSRGGRPNEGVRNVQRTTRATGSSSVPLQNLQSSTIYFMSWYASLAPHTIVCAVKATSAGDWAKGPWVAHTTRMCRCAVQAAHRREPGTGRDKCISMGAHSRGVWFRQHLHEQMTSDDLSDTSCCMPHVPITL